MDAQQHANWIAQAHAHWKEHQPQRYKALKAAGTLGQALTQAAEATSQQLQTLREQGIPPDSAWEMVKEQHLFPPEEKGASPEAPPSDGFRVASDVNEGWGDILMPGERVPRQR